MERAVVTGGAGFIGSHLVEQLLDTGASVMVFDDFRLGRREHLVAAEPADRLTVVEGDIRSADDLKAVTDFAPDAVFHLAALHFIPYCNAHPDEALDVNVLGLNAVIRSVRSVPLTSFLSVSSGAIYGFSDDPWTEDAPARPDEIYGISKWLGERIMADFHEDRPEVRSIVARLFNTYGPRETNPHVLPEVMKTLAIGKPIELGNMWPKRDLIYVTDTAAAFVAAATAGGPGLEVFNVGTGTGTAIQDVMAVIEEITGHELDVRQVPSRMREGDGHLISDPSKLMKATGWTPRNDLKTGLRKLLESEGLA
ncbi:MAG TPA: NAD-dependent epimerase/dehydratase family protein [Streptosporangiaceae bacterium]|nr:NAD-dependent epimerase/dehydratase family protein [Streptosporangiaceae bacterium]